MGNERIAINSDVLTQGNLNILFVMDCDANDWNAQFVAANTLILEISKQVTAKYDILQYCNNANNAGIYVGNISDIDSFNMYSTSSPITSAGYTQASAVDGNNLFIAGALEACSMTFDTKNDGDTTPFLCIPFVSKEFEDTFESMAIMLNEIYIAFMVDENDNQYTDDLYSVLGAFGTGTECIDRMDSAGSYSNSWWQSKFNCDSTTTQKKNCPHCINYASSDELNCASTEIKNIFLGEGVMESKVTIAAEQQCNDKYLPIYYYCIGAVLPLLFWVFIVVIVLCCNSIKNKKNRNNMEQHNGLNNNDQKPQTAFV